MIGTYVQTHRSGRISERVVDMTDLVNVLDRAQRYIQRKQDHRLFDATTDRYFLRVMAWFWFGCFALTWAFA